MTHPKEILISHPKGIWLLALQGCPCSLQPLGSCLLSPGFGTELHQLTVRAHRQQQAVLPLGCELGQEGQLAGSSPPLLLSLASLLHYPPLAPSHKINNPPGRWAGDLVPCRGGDFLEWDGVFSSSGSRLKEIALFCPTLANSESN